MTTVRFPAGLLWASLLLVLTVAGAVVWGVAHFENDLGARASSALEEEGLDLEVRLDGRDAVVRGRVRSDAEAALATEIVSDVRGMRRVDLEVTLATAPGAGTGGGG